MCIEITCMDEFEHFFFLMQKLPGKTKGRPSAAMKEALAAYAACEEQRKVNYSSILILSKHNSVFLMT